MKSKRQWRFGYIDYSGMTGLQKAILDSGSKLNLLYCLEDSSNYRKNIQPNEKTDFIVKQENTTLYNTNLEGLYKNSDFVVFNSRKSEYKYKFKDYFTLSKKYNVPIINLHNNAAYKLENDRSFGKSIAKDLGIAFMPNIDSLDKGELKAFIRKHKKVVFKTNSSNSYTYIPKSTKEALDIVEYDLLDYLKNKSCIIEKFVEGKELCIGFYFNGKDIVGNAIFYNQEYKQLLDGDKSNILTGEVGTMFKVDSFDNATPFVKNLVNNLKTYLTKIDYKGFIDMNCIKSNEDKPVLLEFTCREGFPTQFIVPFVANIGDFYACTAGLLPTVKVKFGYYCAICFHSGTISCQFSPLSYRTCRFPLYNLDKNCLPMTAKYTEDGKLITHSMLDRELYVVGYNKNSCATAISTAYKSANKVETFLLDYRKDIGYNWVEPSEFFK